jgi:hypothetical protein
MRFLRFLRLRVLALYRRIVPHEPNRARGRLTRAVGADYRPLALNLIDVVQGSEQHLEGETNTIVRQSRRESTLQ